ncbi:MAG: DUF6064 family protein [Gemmatimonadales bacterium]
MQVPFTLEQFLGVFQAYNAGVGVAPLVLTMLGAAIAGLAMSRYPWRHRAVAGGLGVLWLWAGVVYHWGFFSRINPAAWLFGALFVLEAVLLAVYGVVRGRLLFTPRRDGASALGFALVLYALVIYPALGWMLGHGYPSGPSFGAPCPSTILFFGVVLWAIDTVPVAVVIVPMLWAAAGTSAALQLGMREDIGLPVAAAIVLFALTRRRVRYFARVPL